MTLPTDADPFHLTRKIDIAVAARHARPLRMKQLGDAYKILRAYTTEFTARAVEVGNRRRNPNRLEI